MGQVRVIDGTSEEISSLLLTGALDGHKLRVIVDPEDEYDPSNAPPSIAIRDREHLEALLLEGFQREPKPVTDETWRERHARIDRRRSE